MIRALSAFSLIFLVAACGKPFSVAQVTSTPDLTGAKNADGIPYTGASESSDLELLKQAIDPTPKENLDLAASITNVVVTHSDSSKLNIVITFGTKAATYAANLNSSLDDSSVTSKDSDIKLSVHGLNSELTAIQVRLSIGTAEAGLIYRVRPVTVDVLGPFSTGGQATTKLDHVTEKISAEKAPLITTTEVAWGPAMFSLAAGDVQASGDLVATGGDESNVVIKAKDEAAVQGRLVGNSNHGDLLMRIADGSAWAFLRVRLPAEKTSTGATVPDDSDDDSTSGEAPAVDTTPVGERYVPYDITNEITARFQRDLNNPIVQDEIKNISVGRRAPDMKKFLSRAHPNLPALIADLSTQNIPPEFMFIMFIESQYFYSPKDNFQISVSRTGAVGPWQFMPDTGRGLGLKIVAPTPVKSRIVNGKQLYSYDANPCDERADLHKSTLAAAKYMRELLGAFKNDPKLAVMAYNMGGGGLNKRLKAAAQQLEAYDMAKIGYWEFRKLNIGPQESRDYVIRFLAAQFVGRAPLSYGITVDTSYVTLAPALPPACSLSVK